MGKHLVYIAGAFTIIIIICSIVAVTTNKSSYTNNKRVPNNTINDISINKDDVTVTTDIWDYIRSRDENTIGDSSNSNNNDNEPKLTIVLK